MNEYSDYDILLNDFLERKITLDQFLEVFFKKWPDDVDSLDKQKGDLIEELFYTAESYAPPRLYDKEAGDTTEEEVCKHAKEILAKLKELKNDK